MRSPWPPSCPSRRGAPQSSDRSFQAREGAGLSERLAGRPAVPRSRPTPPRMAATRRFEYLASGSTTEKNSSAYAVRSTSDRSSGPGPDGEGAGLRAHSIRSRQDCEGGEGALPVRAFRPPNGSEPRPDDRRGWRSLACRALRPGTDDTRANVGSPGERVGSRRIARALNEEQLANPRTNEPWSFGQVQEILRAVAGREAAMAGCSVIAAALHPGRRSRDHGPWRRRSARRLRLR